ncbi:MAG TPA: SPOR domain-containing protein [Trueperaceae bacterium]|nr:SPOR domain-containing protein [Trueperaceae bacterium]
MLRRAHRLALSLLAALVAGGSLPASAQSIAYTVQVVALSDREAALSVQTDLLRQGFPAYVVRSTSAQGDVFRVRVGAFANRPAALLYAAEMPPVSGGQPVPALAEGIPPGITPLAPALLLQLSAQDDALVYEWEEGLALRLPRADGPAEYVLVSGGEVERHTAYLLGERDGARLWVRETSLYPPTWREEPEAVNEGFRASLLRLLAERLGVDVAEVEAAEFRPSAEAAPRLVVVELEAPEEPDGVRLLGLGLPAGGMGEHGPLEYLGVEPEELPVPPEAAVTVGELRAAPPASVEGEAFLAVADDAFSLLEAAGSRWRAVLGAPLWTDGEHLLAVAGDQLLVYGFTPR